MGYFSHQVTFLIGSCWDKDKQYDMEAWIDDMNRRWSAHHYMKYGKDEGPIAQNNIIIKGEPQNNDYITYVFTCDGSKEGWPTSTYADLLREEFILRGKEYGFYGGTVRMPEDQASFWTPA